MIPLYLTLSGIYSYREQQEIDFQALTAAHLFGIFGPVGSGKSAILESILFALYGETDRLNNRESRSYNMMNLKSKEAFIRFDFLAPGGKGKFRATVRGKRNSKNKEDVKFERSLYRVTDTDLIPVESADIQSILGISYENFRRTIIIPQGKFQEFLQLSATQRTDMVKELFNLQKFDLSAKTGSLQKKNDQAVSVCEGQLKQLGEVSEEEIHLKKDETGRLTLELDQTRLLLKQREMQESEMQRISELHTALVNNRKILAGLEIQKESIQKAEQRLNDFDECVSGFKSDFDLLDNQKQQFDSGSKNLGLKQAELAVEQEKLLLSEQRFNQARKDFENREELLKQANELDQCAKINNFNKTVSELSLRIANGEIKISEATKEWESLKSKAKEFMELQETLKAQLPDIIDLQRAKEWFNQARLLQERLDGHRQKETTLVEEITGFSSALAEISRKHEFHPGGSALFGPQLPLLLESLKKETESALKHYQNQLLQLEVQDKLKTFASNLQDGEPCPLCGSTDHPNILSGDGFENEYRQLQANCAATEKQLQLIDSSITRSGMLLESISRKQPELEAVSKELKTAQTAQLDHMDKFSRTGLTEEKLDTELNRYSLLQQEIEKLFQQAKEANSKSDTEGQRVNDFNQKLEELRKEMSLARHNAEILISQLTRIDYTLYHTTTAEALLAESASQKRKYSTIGEEFSSAEKLQNSRSAAVQILTGTVQTIQQTLISLSEAIRELQKQLDARIVASRFRNETLVREILTSKVDRQKEQLLIQEFRDKFSSVTSYIEQLEKQIEGKTYQPEDHEKLKLEISGLRQNETKQNQLKIAADIELARLNKALSDSHSLKAELRTLEIRRDNLKTLSDLFRAQGFVNFVSTIHLQNLVQGANERFYRLTRQQLKLELDEENNFRVRDYLNEGQWRNVKTLSGGQTFQASLCLALSLADNIQQLNQNGQNFFFLDEGFGTLDRESLELVFETLKSLRRENRVVGVISHVEDLQQEINAWLRVTRDEEHGSVVKASWE